MEPVLEYICQEAERILSPIRIVLFGSRARGDQSEKSDYDLAFELKPDQTSSWAAFKVKVRDEAPTLCELDLVDLSAVDEGFRERILSEGREIWPRNE